MTTIAAYPLLTCAQTKRSWSDARAVEKSSAQQKFQGEYETGDAPQSPKIAQTAKRALCQFETQDHASLWNGPRLRPAFVAQVLGQAMNTAEVSAPRAQAAYRGLAIRTAAILDECL
jgi:hypothetical protein